MLGGVQFGESSCWCEVPGLLFRRVRFAGVRSPVAVHRSPVYHSGESGFGQVCGIRLLIAIEAPRPAPLRPYSPSCPASLVS